MFAKSQQELIKLVDSDDSGVEETNEVVMGDETDHLKNKRDDSSDGSFDSR